MFMFAHDTNYKFCHTVNIKEKNPIAETDMGAAVGLVISNCSEQITNWNTANYLWVELNAVLYTPASKTVTDFV